MPTGNVALHSRVGLRPSTQIEAGRRQWKVFSILAGKPYRTPDGEVRVARAVDRGEVEMRGPFRSARTGNHCPRVVQTAPAGAACRRGRRRGFVGPGGSAPF